MKCREWVKKIKNGQSKIIFKPFFKNFVPEQRNDFGSEIFKMWFGFCWSVWFSEWTPKRNATKWNCIGFRSGL